MKYKYNGGLSAEKLGEEEVVLVNGKVYEFKPDLKRVQTLVKLGFLEEIKETKIENTKKGQK